MTDEFDLGDEKPRSGKAKGGHARAAALSPTRRSEIGKKAAAKRWAEKSAGDSFPRVLESFKGKITVGGAQIPCAIIMGPNGVQRVLSENGIGLN